jgi:hypothetical protein
MKTIVIKDVIHVQDGYRWTISADPVFGFTYVHEDYDGDEDNRCGFSKSVADCIAEIEDLFGEDS